MWKQVGPDQDQDHSHLWSTENLDIAPASESPPSGPPCGPTGQAWLPTSCLVGQCFLHLTCQLWLQLCQLMDLIHHHLQVLQCCYHCVAGYSTGLVPADDVEEDKGKGLGPGTGTWTSTGSFLNCVRKLHFHRSCQCILEGFQYLYPIEGHCNSLSTLVSVRGQWCQQFLGYFSGWSIWAVYPQTVY